MKKWKKSALSIGLASTLVMPSFAAASTTVDHVQAFKDREPINVLSQLNLTDKEQRLLALEQQKDANDLVSEDTLIIKYSEKLSSKLHNRAGMQVVRSFPSLGYDVVKLKKGRSMEGALRSYSSEAAVVGVTPSVSFEYQGIATTDPKKDSMYHLSLLEIDEALSLAGEHEVTVAVVDSAIDVDHPELKSKILPPYTVGDPATIATPYVHATHVGGIVAGEANNGVGGHGVNPNATIMPVDVSQLTDYAIAEGILYAVDNGADVINLSLGFFYPSPIVKDAVERAIEADVVVVAAAGNYSSDEYFYPAAFEGVIGVGATNDQNKLASFSNYGPSVDIVAPGEDVYNSTFDLIKGSSFDNLSGTSMSSPVVAGVASLILSKYPDLKPYEVEAILERTALDLGDVGYDTKFAHGLVNPVAALKYDISQLPELNEWNDEKILAEGEVVALVEEAFMKKGKLTSPEQIDWLKVDLEAGQSLQTVLDISADYDYKMELRFYPEGAMEASETLDVNAQLAGGAEAKLFTAREKGTLAIGISDVNDNYSLGGKSSYELTMQHFNELYEDGVTKYSPVAITSLPFNSNKVDVAPLTFLHVDENGEQVADKDYFSFSVEEPQMINIALSGVAGINSSLNVYFAESLYMEIPPDVPVEDYFMYEPYPVETANEGLAGEGESLTFEAMPGMEYVIEVSSEPHTMFSIFDILFGFGAMVNESTGVPASALPYEVTMKTVEIPADEDGFPMIPQFDETLAVAISEGTEDIDLNQYLENKQAAIEDELFFMFGGSFSYFSEEEVDQILASALPFSIGDKASGYFQSSFDQDFYTITPEKDAIYQFSFDDANTIRPMLEIFEYDEEAHALFPLNNFGFGMEESGTTIALESGNTYYVSARNGMYRPSEEAYKLMSKEILEVPYDENEKNDELIQATVLQPNSPVRGQFILSGDVDMYYYKHRSADVNLGFDLTINPLSNELESTLPTSVKNPLIVLAQIVEDTNGNMSIDDEEISKSIPYYPYALEGLSGSFEAKEDVGYFIITMNDSWMGLSAQSYDISINQLNSQDEDVATVVTNNIPSEPLQLMKKEQGYEATGYFNANVDFGDKDYYELNVESDATFDVTLDMPEGIDGVVTIYNSDGLVVKTLDNYGAGDQEMATVSLPTGKYYFEVKEFSFKYSNEPYTLRVAMGE
ncbi:S8 family serine peptidase [Cytobacillus sp. IB215665]|uniref:S8 family serine peptidase n=1 Tax=Cytobacillus sp. IB215665 TaxID=3097357 RepID=UPI002A171804|nr:S8 family serine peptidase [Cytobacillus sp. IB215665]MDX8363767.1 S8 family serine peptidase [Cytobacillus sp. IB215665]